MTGGGCLRAYCESTAGDPDHGICRQFCCSDSDCKTAGLTHCVPLNPAWETIGYLSTPNANAAGPDGWATCELEPWGFAAAGALLAGFAGVCAQHPAAHGTLDVRDAPAIWRRQLEPGASTPW
jgi:hypothetical protein